MSAGIGRHSRLEKTHKESKSLQVRGAGSVCQPDARLIELMRICLHGLDKRH